MKDNLKRYKLMLRHRCKQYQQHKLSEDLYDMRWQMHLDRYLINTRRKENTSAEAERRDLVDQQLF